MNACLSDLLGLYFEDIPPKSFFQTRSDNPCSVEENYDGLLEIAQSVKKAGAKVLRGGAFKPRTSPYEFQGLEEVGLKYLSQASKSFLTQISLFNSHLHIHIFANIKSYHINHINT